MLFTSTFAVFVSLATLIIGLPTPLLPRDLMREGQLSYCSDVLAGILSITNVSVTPYPLRPGQNATLSASGALSEAINQGAKVRVTVALPGNFTVYDQQVDLCQAASLLGHSCPINPGPLNVTVTETIPSQLPAVNYTVRVNATNSDGKPIICFEGPVQVSSS
ncbi:hypothetical protein SpCBS45565_g01130 [Spizellomyces sp. 'palustris']|nr:hypothetical protein SpCBS45565_g01130 [Spizellomyces sp. 'palustris']